ncbi:hypothetical protein IMCC3317_10210 [Kordia antarctica]|uniref:Uncharacterized protein n=1 Tax=Kordia antarctica TaxID=1218801 RepID=A0A7L4ZIB9_9FLAO|nr:hypothetical protein [Kordia antarctica]QHI35674.1 hypothetical protein IMCC3317_10210 [Kordia antarctica]
MQGEPSYDPFQLQNAPTEQKFSWQEKVVAIVLVVIFATIPLYEISSDAFKVNYVQEYSSGPICASSYFQTYKPMNLQYSQGKSKIKQ